MESSSYFTFNRPFRIKILALLLDSSWMYRYSTLVTADYFEANDEREVCDALLSYYKKYNRVPQDADDVLIMCEGNHRDIIEVLFEWEHDTQLARDMVIQWVKEQAAKNAILESVDDIRTGDLSKLIPRLKDALAVGDDSTTLPGLDFVADSKDWLYNLWVDKVRTGWYHVDMSLEGGLARGELGYIIAPSNRGKSMALTNIAYGAASIGSGLNVAIFSHEMNERLYAKRIAARMVHKFPKRNDDLKEYEADFQLLARRLMPGNIRIISGKMSVYDVETHLRRMVANGFTPDVVIDDYSDKLAPPFRREQRRFEFAETADFLRDLSMPGAITDDGFAMWSASQTGRDSFNKPVIRESDIAESIEKVAIADVVIALCQTEEEYNNSICRMFGAKVRDGERGFMVEAKYYQKSQCIITTGHVDMSGAN